MKEEEMEIASRPISLHCTLFCPESTYMGAKFSPVKNDFCKIKHFLIKLMLLLNKAEFMNF